MFWFKRKIFAGLLLTGIALFCLPACKPNIQKGDFFDLKGFITKDAARLDTLNPAVEKTVYHNGVTETKAVHISDWKSELGMFIDADINKPSWKSSYEVNSEDSLLVYRAKDKELLVQHLDIKHAGQKVLWILVYTKVSNMLYNTTQKLTYYPDSLYAIEMVQHVRLNKTNVYKIQGKILK